MKKWLIVGIVLIVLAFGLFLYSDSGDSIGTGYIERVFVKESVAPGEVVDVQLKIELTEDQNYYLLEEIVPESFTVLDDVAKGNRIRLIEIQGAESNVFSYSVKAPEEAGDYVFSGEYGMEGIEGTLDILGDSSIIVE